MANNKEKIYIDYSGKGQCYSIDAGKMFSSAKVIFKELTERVLSFCSLGFEFKPDRPTYRLRFSSQAWDNLSNEQCETLETIIKYHNQIVEKVKEYSLQEL